MFFHIGKKVVVINKKKGYNDEKVFYKSTGLEYKVIGRIETSTENWSEQDRKRRGDITKFYLIGRPKPQTESNLSDLDLEQAFEDDLKPVEEVKK